jgi:hypothetical protein
VIGPSRDAVDAVGHSPHLRRTDWNHAGGDALGDSERGCNGGRSPTPDAGVASMGSLRSAAAGGAGLIVDGRTRHRLDKAERSSDGGTGVQSGAGRGAEKVSGSRGGGESRVEEAEDERGGRGEGRAGGRGGASDPRVEILRASGQTEHRSSSSTGVRASGPSRALVHASTPPLTPRDSRGAFAAATNVASIAAATNVAAATTPASAQPVPTTSSLTWSALAKSQVSAATPRSPEQGGRNASQPRRCSSNASTGVAADASATAMTAPAAQTGARPHANAALLAPSAPIASPVSTLWRMSPALSPPLPSPPIALGSLSLSLLSHCMCVSVSLPLSVCVCVYVPVCVSSPRLALGYMLAAGSTKTGHVLTSDSHGCTSDTLMNGSQIHS